MYQESNMHLTLLHSEGPKLHGVLAVLSAKSFGCSEFTKFNSFNIYIHVDSYLFI